MKIKFFLFLCWFLLIIKCSTEIEECDDITEAESKDECFKWDNDTDTEYYGYRCCYVKENFKVKPDDREKENSYCYGISKEEFEELDEFIKEYKNSTEEDDGELEDFEFVCSSSSIIFLKICLFSLIVALLI